MEKTDEIDESLYSRQLYVMGHEAQKKMAASNVLIVGLDGLGVEVAKNVVLAGVKSVTLYDSKVTSYSDLSAQFYLTEADIGKNRAEVSAPKLAELNPYVPVSILNGELTPSAIAGRFTVVVLIDTSLEKQQEIAQYCHVNGISVIIGHCFGVFGNIFCDFGENFVVHDTTGEPVISSMISGITLDSTPVVTVLEDTRHNLETGDVVVLSDIVGMEELNGKHCKVTVKDPQSFQIDVDTSNFSSYERGGYVNQVKQPTNVSFKPFGEALHCPGEFVCDFVKMHYVPALHFAFQALHAFAAAHGGELPEAGNVAHAEEVYQLAHSINNNAAAAAGGQVGGGDGGSPVLHLPTADLEASKNVILRLALCCRGQISPICALLGGILGQEVLKACSGKFMPIKQWFYYDAVEALSDEPLSQAEVSPIQCRYDGQLMVFGKDIQQRLGQLNMFLVGAGAIGCEMVKNWAMMGVACEANVNRAADYKIGTVHVTDMDQIEKSNLSRQFLFRNSDINRPKSTTAVKAVTMMNPTFHAVALESKVAPDTEHIFNDDFFESLDMVCTALDNVEARLFIDQKCLFYQKPMLESGTLGAKGHTQIVSPYQTENYGATRDPPEKSIPVCTLKHFPNQIDHTLQWARDWFEEVYKQTAEDVNQYLSLASAEEYGTALAAQQNMRMDTLTRVHDSLLTPSQGQRPQSFDDCLAWARRCFEDLFCNRVKQLLHNFPLDRMTSGGTPFWSGAKRPPTPLEYNPADPLHAEFIAAAASLRATMFGLPAQDRPSEQQLDAPDVLQRLASQAATFPVEKFRPQEGVKIATTDEEAKADAEGQKFTGPADDIDAQCDAILNSLPPASSSAHLRMYPIDFDKDIDSQMRVVAAVSNLRARNYNIPEADLHTSRGIAGKITPAIATTTALVTGAICVEVYKLLQKKPVEKLMNTFANLALPLFTSMEPEPPKNTVAVVKGKEWKWNQWDRVDISDPTLTVEGLINKLEEDYGVELSMLSTGVTILYSDFMDRKKMKDRKGMTLKEVVETVTKKSIPPEQKYLIFELIVNDCESGDEVEIPYLRFKLY